MSKRIKTIFGKRSERNPYALFETPDEVVLDLLEFCNTPSGPEWNLDLLEPGAGTGRIARQLRDRLPNSQLDLFEIDELSQQELVDDGFNLVGRDFLVEPAPREYDFVFLNPPFSKNVYINHIMRAFGWLKLNGIVGAIVPESFLRLSTRKGKSFREFVAEFGYWESIGSPFEYTQVNCYQLKIDRLSPENLARYWSPSNGYQSTYQEQIEIALSCDRPWYEFLSRIKEKPKSEWRRLLSKELDRVVQGRFIQREGWCFLYNDRVKEQLIQSQLQDLEDH